MNVAKLLAEAVKKLYSEAVTMPEEDVSEQEDAIQQIEEHVDDLNYAMGNCSDKVLYLQY